MKKINTDILIIGAGLTGLTLAYLLRDSGKKVVIAESRSRTGGRIFTVKTKNKKLEMGATWLGSQHTRLTRLLDKMDIPLYEQALGDTAFYEPMSTSPPQLVQLPPNSDPSFKIKHGSQELTDRLLQSIDPDNAYLDTAIQKIIQQEDRIIAHATHAQFNATTIISTLPPHLLLSTVAFVDPLPNELIKIAQATHTWMGESIKICLSYKQAFWKVSHSSGTVFSNVGPIPELYDHSDHQQNTLVGFLNSAYFSNTKEERLQRILHQMVKYYGDRARSVEHYEEYVWRNDPYTFYDYSTPVLPHQNNGHPIFNKAYLNDKLWVAGSETAGQNPGYMEGAVRSAEFIYQKLIREKS